MTDDFSRKNADSRTGSTSANWFSPMDLFVTLWRQRRFIAKVSLISAVVAAALLMFVPKQYESTVRLMPPDAQTNMGLALLSGGLNEQVSSFASEALGLHSAGAMYIGVMRSRSVQDALIDRFSLMRVYKAKLRYNARKVLSASTELEEDRKSGIVVVTVRANSPELAAKLASGYADELNNLLATRASSAARREREFIEVRLKLVKADMDSVGTRLSQFSSKTATVDIREQARAMVEATAQLQGQLISAEAQLRGLLEVYKSEHVRVRTQQARINELRSKLAQFKGAPPPSQRAGVDAASGDFPSLRQLPVVGLAWTELYRESKIQEAIYEILRKQYELAKIQEVRSIPTVRLLDEAEIPEVKVYPQRITTTLLVGFMAAFLAMVYVLARSRWKMLETDHPLRAVGWEVASGLKEDAALARVMKPKQEEPQQV